MAFHVAELYATIRADDTQIQSAMPKLQAKLERVKVAMDGVSRYARRMFLVVAGALALTVKLASDAEETHSKFMTVFGESAKAVETWSNQYSKAVGRARVDTERYLASMQDILVPMGVAEDKAVELSKSLVVLGLDLASFNNEADDTVMSNLQSALVGQSRAVLNYGIAVGMAEVKQELLNMGIKRGYDEATNAEKIQARVNIMYRSSTKAVGDLIRTQGSFENQLKALISSLKDMSAQIGQAFIPALKRMITLVRNVIVPLGEWVTQNQSLVLWIGGVTTATLGLLAVLPLLITSLTVLGSHPVAFALSIAAAAIALMVIRIEALNAAIRTTAAIAPSKTMTTEALKRRLKDITMQAANTRAEIEALEAQGMDAERAIRAAGTSGPLGVATEFVRHLIERQSALRTLRLEEQGYAEDVRATTLELASRIDAVKPDDKPIGRVLPTEAEHEKLEAVLKEIEDGQKTAHQRRLDEIEEEMWTRLRAAQKALATAEEIIAIQDDAIRKQDKADQEHLDALAKEKALKEKLAKLEAARIKSEAEAKVAEKMGSMRGAAAFSGIAEQNRRVQEYIFRREEKAEFDKRHNALMEKQTAIIKATEAVTVAVQAQDRSIINPT